MAADDGHIVRGYAPADLVKDGVLYADPPWRFKPRSGISGMDRSATRADG
jgi:hypothetical protein